MNGQNYTTQMIGDSDALNNVRYFLQCVAESEVDCLLLGETGTGKELVANEIHALSARKHSPFVAVNCSALSENLLESELFGHVKGAFTGATKDKIGRFELAQGGTLLLDEIGEMPLHLQVKLLRVLQERKIERVGEVRPRDIDVRIIAATNKDLQKMVDNGELREDFYYRLKVFPINLPPLRERQGDIPLLANHFLAKYTPRSGKKIEISPEAIETLCKHSWPGNVRELENAIQYALVLCRGKNIEVAHLPRDIMDKRGYGPIATSMQKRRKKSKIKEALLSALEEAEGNRTEAGRILGVSRVTIWKWMKKYGLTDFPQNDCHREDHKVGIDFIKANSFRLGVV